MARTESEWWGQVWELYRNNLRISLSFAILLVFVFFFQQFNNTALLDGTIFFDYSFSLLSVEVVAALVGGSLVFLAMYAILLSLLLLAVRNDLSHVPVKRYLRDMMEHFFLTMFIYFVLLSLLFVLVVSAGLFLGLDIVWINLALFLVSLSFIFVPQSLVVDEKPIIEAIKTNWYVIFKYPKDFLLILVVSTLLVGLLPLVEAGIDSILFVGRYITLVLMFVLVIPFIEILKTILYMRRFELVRGHEYASRHHAGLRGHLMTKIEHSD
ncbi:MAG: hypothetical protein Q8P05_06230 [Candidatus Diapherotrites archaeon]|nr:hypothetical protein [Candidatus Diapherotrites archaeon]MDZ4256380.1 hypothetical protein [archaeon]